MPICSCCLGLGSYAAKSPDGAFKLPVAIYGPAEYRRNFARASASQPSVGGKDNCGYS
jgi:hypothetical protein